MGKLSRFSSFFYIKALCRIILYEYNLKDDRRSEKLNHIGVLAHELQEKFPEINSLVTGKKDEVDEKGEEIRQSVSTEISYVLIKALQEQNEIIKKLQNQIDDLQNQINKLKN